MADVAADLTYRLRSADPDTARYEERIVLHELTQCGLVPPGWLGRSADDLRWREALARGAGAAAAAGAIGGAGRGTGGGAMSQKHRKPGAEPDSGALPGYPKRCAGVGAGDTAVRCATPHFDVQLSGRCTRCDQLHRRAELATADPWSSLNRPLFGNEIDEARASEETPIPQRRGFRHRGHEG